MRVLIRTAWAALHATAATLTLGGAVLVAGLVGVRAEFFDWAARNWSRWILWASGVTVSAEGLEHIRPDRPQIIVGNHQSWYDVLAVASVVPKTFRFVAKKELEAIPLFGPAWKAAGHISVDRQDRKQAVASLARAGEQLVEERSAVIIFPEGTRSWDGEMLPFKKGAFVMAIHTAVEMVPFAVTGTRRVFPKGSWRVRSGSVMVRFGAPIPTADLAEADRDRLLLRVRRRIQEMLDESRAALT